MNTLFEECVKEFVTPEIQKQVDLLVAISNRIYDILDKKGMTQKDLAQKLNKSEAEVSRWLGGTHNLTVSTIAKISTALGEDIIITPIENTYILRCISHTTEISPMDSVYEDTSMPVKKLNSLIEAA